MMRGRENRRRMEQLRRGQIRFHEWAPSDDLVAARERNAATAEIARRRARLEMAAR